MERRKAKRNRIMVDIEVAQPGSKRCFGFADNISRNGVSMVLQEGELPSHQRSVVLNFKIWTGDDHLYRKMYARVIRFEDDRVALEFAEHDLVSEAIVQDLMYFQRQERRRKSRTEQAAEAGLMDVRPAEQVI